MVMQLSKTLADRSRWKSTECSIGKTMDLIGSKVPMLIVREAFYGTTRFDDFTTRVGITPAVAATRLKELIEAGVLEKQPYREPGQRSRNEYVLTPRGEDLLPVLLSLMQWGDRHLQDDEEGPLLITSRQKQHPVSVRVQAGETRPLRSTDLDVIPNRNWVKRHRRGTTAEQPPR